MRLSAHDEPGVESGSDTETLVALHLEIDSRRWAGVPWIIRAGKGLDQTVTEAVVEFQQPPRPLFADPDCPTPAIRASDQYRHLMSHEMPSKLERQ